MLRYAEGEQLHPVLNRNSVHMNQDYQYRTREVEKDHAMEFRLREGRISGYLSLTLGLLSLLAVLAYLYPSYLTATELRRAYDALQLQQVLRYGMYFSLLFGFLAVALNTGQGIGFSG